MCRPFRAHSDGGAEVYGLTPVVPPRGDDAPSALRAAASGWHFFGVLMAAAAVVVLPMIVLVFFSAQRTFMQGIGLAGLKG